MRYKDDWSMAKQRLTAFWEQEIIDRCCVSVTVSDPAFVPDIVPQDQEERDRYWTDPEWIISRERRKMEHTYYGGEAFPVAFPNFGSAGHAGFFKGAKHKFVEDTVWFFPSIESTDEMEYDKNTFLRQKTLEAIRCLAEDSRGDYCVAMPDTGGNADALAHLLGSDVLLEEMLDDPDAVQRGMDKMQIAFEDIVTDVYDIVRDVNDGGSCIGWLNTWAPGRQGQMQCDLSCMISPAMYKEFIVPELQKHCRFLDYPLYHFDGMEQIRHLDYLLSIPELRAIQWTQVAGQPPCTEFMSSLKRIQEAGKSLVIVVDPSQIRPLMENLSSKGLYMLTTASSKEDADAILKEVSRLTHD